MVSMTGSLGKLMKVLCDDEIKSEDNKISIIGSGNLGITSAMSLLYCGLSSAEICLFDIGDMKNAEANLLAIEYCVVHLPGIRVTYGSDFSAVAGSRICIICLETLRVTSQEFENNIRIYKRIIPKIAKFAPNTILMVATYPYNVMAYTAWRLSNFPKNRVLGIGTLLDSINFRIRVANRFDVSPSLCYGWIIGADMKNCLIPIWTSVSIAGTHLIDIVPNLGSTRDPSKWYLLGFADQHGDKNNDTNDEHQQSPAFNDENPDEQPNDDEENPIDTDLNNRRTLDSYVLRSIPTDWQAGAAVAILCRAICRNTREVFAVSTYAKGIHGINVDVFLSFPCIIGINGVHSIVELSLKRYELNNIRKAAIIFKRALGSLKFK